METLARFVSTYMRRLSRFRFPSRYQAIVNPACKWLLTDKGTNSTSYFWRFKRENVINEN